MTVKPPYDLLFEPVRIGPVTAPNRFFQVPHCNGFGHLRPRGLAAMRGMKAEGGWGVVCTEEVEIHPTSEISPAIEGRIWDDRDIPAHRLVTDAIHAHGALAGIELVHNGLHAPNRISRLPPMAPSAAPVDSSDPLQARAMDLTDIRNFRRWHREAALRAKAAGYDIVYAYAAHGMSTLMHFMQLRHNQRCDEYGGSLENRVRLTREVISEIKDAVGDSCAVAFRFAVDELLGEEGLSVEGETRDIVGLLAELPDLWDVNVSGWANDSATARFEPVEGYQESYTAFVKSMTSKPVVGVGRFTSPDAMVSQVRRGVLDLIGAARPSIADPFLPAKIRDDRIEAIRECIGCNICVSGDYLNVPIRCTQNPTMGEEWRRGWHPEKIAPKASDDRALVVGGGPSGLECALQLGQRGYRVTLAEGSSALGGRSLLESRLPGLSSTARVKDYREGLLKTMAGVEIYLESPLDSDSILEFGFPHVFLATGSAWRRDGTGRENHRPLRGLERLPVFTPDDIMAGKLPAGGRVTVFDDDHYYLGGVIAEKLADTGCDVTLVTPALTVSAWTDFTLEQDKIITRLLEKNVELTVRRNIAEVLPGGLRLACTHTGRTEDLEADALVLVTARDANDALYRSLSAEPDRLSAAGIQSLQRIGDCLAPGTIANAVYLGHLAAQNFQDEDWDTALFRREMTALA
ncbi:FAD-dependent oxidoreductase [Denitrobaculum tricleocarpae]|uniref:NADH:flavin oxidoreductase n=1 Tax=Denitrobaculum tricleocarpae TaxID=2591009 RepID=A0A545TYC5_9PROT|nr:FAD-dependent oxidoreductase [Denitrobaculum tricleocarpae]TQV82238.1 NADH:flavin oxidoreductase [Denitrobaculum tricleocarpae]